MENFLDSLNDVVVEAKTVNSAKLDGEYGPSKKINKPGTYDNVIITGIDGASFEKDGATTKIIKLQFETPKLEVEGFEPADTAIRGGQVGVITLGFLTQGDSESIEKINNKIGVFAKILGIEKEVAGKKLGEALKMLIEASQKEGQSLNILVKGDQKLYTLPDSGKVVITYNLSLPTRGFASSKSLEGKYDETNAYLNKPLSETDQATYDAANAASESTEAAPVEDASSDDLPF